MNELNFFMVFSASRFASCSTLHEYVLFYLIGSAKEATFSLPFYPGKANSLASRPILQLTRILDLLTDRLGC